MATMDPVAAALHSIISGLGHFNDKQMTMRHMDLVMAVKLGCDMCKSKTITRRQILLFSSIQQDDFEAELRYLIDHFYIAEIIPTFGDPTYSVGRMGGTALHPIIKAVTPPSTRKEPAIGVARPKNRKAAAKPQAVHLDGGQEGGLRNGH